jgi:hypothetical protein
VPYQLHCNPVPPLELDDDELLELDELLLDDELELLEEELELDELEPPAYTAAISEV